MQKIGKFGRDRIAIGICKENPRLYQCHLRVPLHGAFIQLIEFFDLIAWARFRRRAGKYLAQDDRHLCIMSRQSSEDQVEICRDRFRLGFFFKIVGADEQNDRFRVQRNHILIEPDENAA